VGITSPADGTVFLAPAAITLSASAAVPAGSTIARVEFYQGASLIGTATSAPYSFAWTNVTSGTYALTAAVVDNTGASTSSSAVTVKVNAAPTVTLTSPTSGTNTTAPASITVSADALDSDGSIAKVAFYRNGIAITTLTAAPYSFSWTGVPAGSYVLTAIATDDLGSSSTSAAVTVIVGAGGAQTYYIETDHLNTPRVIEDKSQNLVWSWDQAEPFGDTPPNDSPAGFAVFEFNLRYQGQYSDKETGLFYNYFRDYDPGTGRYPESDPIGLRAGLNTYAYVSSRPLVAKDPLGLVKWTGTMNSIGAEVFGHDEFELESECKCGHKLRTVVKVTYASFGLSAIRSRSNVELEDNFDCPNAMAFDGPAFKVSFGGGIGDGKGFHFLVLGKGTSPGHWSSFDQVFGGAADVSVGSSSVGPIRSEDCCERKTGSGSQ
jgi:RHS repeat-associated protein